MSRELKFRVWDKRLKNYIIGDLFFEQEDNSNFEIDCYHDEEGEIHELKYSQKKLGRYHDYIIQQYTGLKDKNGVDIYEGDIVTYTCNNGITYKAPIVFSPISLSYVLDISGRHLLDDKYGDYLFVYKDLEYEVVGNIFENPELLKNEI